MMPSEERLDDWTDPSRPPADAIDLGGGVWASWPEGNDGYPLIWHWCDRSIALRNRRPGQQDWWFVPRWVAAGGRGHDLISRDPLHLEPSLLWPSCCGLHGFIRGGRWASV